MEGEATHEEVESRPLGRCSILSYGVGHMLNDITSACWFTYLLLYLTDRGLRPRDSAIVMLCGQVTDALMTVITGKLIDKFGRLKLWHAGGSVLVAVSFSSVFGGCIPCQISGTSSTMLQTIGYSIFAAIFNVGWASTQVSHMVMVNCLTLNPTGRVALASCRNAFTMVANLSLFGVAFAVFSLYDAKTSLGIEVQYRWIAFLSIFIGLCFVGAFLIGTKEPRLMQQNLHRSSMSISWAHWFQKAIYYQVALVYMLTRLVTNVSQSLLALYVINDLEMNPSSKALVPAIIYISSFIVSVMLQEITWATSRLNAIFVAGAILWIFSGSGIFILSSKMKSFMYILAVVIGIANAFMTVTVIGMESVLVGEDLNGSAFVYGSLSFLDKMSCGIALYILESFGGSTLEGCHDIRDCQSITRYGSGLIPAACALLSVAISCTMKLQRYSSRSLSQPLLS